MVNPYSAEHPVPPEKFAGRVHQIEEFDRFLADTIDGNFKESGHPWGMGDRKDLAVTDIQASCGAQELCRDNH